MKRLLLTVLPLLLILGCSENVWFYRIHIKDGKFYYENEIYSGKIHGRLKGKVKNGILDGYVYEKHIYEESGVSSGYHLSQEGEYNNGIKEGWWKFYTEYRPHLYDIISGGIYTHLKWNVLYENDQPKQYKEIIYHGSDSFSSNSKIGYEIGPCSSKVNTFSFDHSWLVYDDNIEESFKDSTTIGKTNGCIKSGSYKFFKSTFSSEDEIEYLFEEGQYKIIKEEYFESFYYVKNGPYKRYYETGELREEGNYFKGKEEGSYTRYGKDGKTYKKGEYTQGYDPINRSWNRTVDTK